MANDRRDVDFNLNAKNNMEAGVKAAEKTLKDGAQRMARTAEEMGRKAFVSSQPTNASFQPAIVRQIKVGATEARQILDRLQKEASHVVASSPARSVGFLESLALQAREQRLDRRKSGENALAMALRGPGGLTDFAMDAAGIGLPAMVAESGGRMLADFSQRAVELRDAIREGKADSAEMMRNMATGLPILGGWVKGFMNLRELITGEEMGIRETNASAAAQNSESEARLRMSAYHRSSVRDLTLATARATFARTSMGASGSDQQVGELRLQMRERESKRADELAALLSPLQKARDDAMAAFDANPEKGGRLRYLSGNPYQMYAGQDKEFSREKAQLEAQRKAIEAERDKVVGDERAKFNAKYAAEMARDNARIKFIESEQTRQRAETIRQSGIRLAQAKGEASDMVLRSQGRGFEAERQGLQRGAAMQKEAIAHQASEEIRQAGGLLRAPGFALRTMFGALQEQGVVGTLAGLRGQEIQRRQRASLADQQSGLTGGAFGLITGASDAAGLNFAQRTQQSKVGILLEQQNFAEMLQRSYMENPDASPEMKARAKALGADSAAIARLRMGLVGQDNSPARFAGMSVMGAGYSGRAEYMRDASIPKNSAEQTKLQDRMAKALESLLKLAEERAKGSTEVEMLSGV